MPANSSNLTHPQYQGETLNPRTLNAVQQELYQEHLRRMGYAAIFSDAGSIQWVGRLDTSNAMSDQTV